MPELRKHPAEYAFKAAAWPHLQLRPFKLIDKHCWRYRGAHKRLGAFLAELRVATCLMPELYRELQSLHDQRDVKLQPKKNKHQEQPYWLECNVVAQSYLLYFSGHNSIA